MTASPRPLPEQALIGMVHLPPLPGSPACPCGLADIIARAVVDAERIMLAGFDAIMMENFGDAPFRATQVDPHTVATMTVVGRAVRAAVSLPLGINVLRNDPRAALAIAACCGASFIRVNVHVGVYATDQGIIEGRADDTLRYRAMLRSRPDAPDPIAILADVHVKHARPLSTADIGEAAEETAYRGGADGLIVSGSGTGKPTDIEDLRRVRQAVPDRPVYVGSGATVKSVKALLGLADGVIVGTTIKQGGRTTGPIDVERARQFVEAARS